MHGVTPVVAVNGFPTDHPSERAVIEEVARGCGVRAAVTTHVADGGSGALDLAEAVLEAARERPTTYRPLYPLEAPLREKIETVARRVYGADGVDHSCPAAQQLDAFERHGLGDLPVCIAKTHLSISHDPSLLGAPTCWRLPVREVRASAGAGFVTAVCGEMRTMPGLPSQPAATRIEMDDDGVISGLS